MKYCMAQKRIICLAKQMWEGMINFLELFIERILENNTWLEWATPTMFSMASRMLKSYADRLEKWLGREVRRLISCHNLHRVEI